MTTLKGWYTFVGFAKAAGPRITGKCYGDSRFVDGEVITTTPVISINLSDNTIVTRSGTTYTLEGLACSLVCDPQAVSVQRSA